MPARPFVHIARSISSALSQGTHPMSRSFRVAGSAALMLLTLTAGCGGGDAAEPETATPVTVQVGPEAMSIASVTSLSTGPQLSGELVAERTAQIRAEVSGSVVQVMLDPGSRVAAGTVLARIDDRAIQDSYLSARSGLTAAQNGADIAKREFERAEKLLAAGAIAERELENARRANLGAMSQFEDAKARLSAAQKQFEATTVRAPYAGIVSERMVNPGDVVAPGAPMFSVVDPATMRLEASVPAEQLSAVRVGARVSFSVTGYPGKSFEGTVSHVNPVADPQTRQVRLFVRIPNAGSQLVAGLFAQGRVASETRETLTAPTNAVDQRGLKPTVVRLKGGKTERVEVTLGVRDEATERVEILTGLTPGDTLLIGAALGITPGTPVKVTTPADKPASN